MPLLSWHPYRFDQRVFETLPVDPHALRGAEVRASSDAQELGAELRLGPWHQAKNISEHALDVSFPHTDKLASWQPFVK